MVHKNDAIKTTPPARDSSQSWEVNTIWNPHRISPWVKPDLRSPSFVDITVEQLTPGPASSGLVSSPFGKHNASRGRRTTCKAVKRMGVLWTRSWVSSGQAHHIYMSEFGRSWPARLRSPRSCNLHVLC